jgi:hypothetical protein
VAAASRTIPLRGAAVYEFRFHSETTTAVLQTAMLCCPTITVALISWLSSCPFVNHPGPASSSDAQVTSPASAWMRSSPQARADSARTRTISTCWRTASLSAVSSCRRRAAGPPLDVGKRRRHTPRGHGYEAMREAAMAAFAKALQQVHRRSKTVARRAPHTLVDASAWGFATAPAETARMTAVHLASITAVKRAIPTHRASNAYAHKPS